jgi:serine/alanine adding enzyme
LTPGASASELSVVEVRQVSDGKQWDDFVQSSDEASFCHLWSWRTVIEGSIGHNYYPIGAYEDGRLTGVLPLVHMRAPLLANVLLSMPFLNYGGPIGSPQAKHALVDGALRTAATLGAKSIELRLREPFDLDRDFGSGRDKVLVTLELPADPELLWNSFSSKLRSQIRRPRKSGIVVTHGSHQIDAFYRVFAENMRDLGTPVHGRPFFRDILAHIPGTQISVAWSGATPVAAGFGFDWRGEFEITWASSLRSFSAHAPNMLLYWSMMEAAMERGCRTFNFERSTPDTGTHRFKSQWGGETANLAWLRWPDRAASHEKSRPSAASVAARAWSGLPLVIANRIGPLLSRSLPWW